MSWPLQEFFQKLTTNMYWSIFGTNFHLSLIIIINSIKQDKAFLGIKGSKVGGKKDFREELRT
jgi:hypothetical protein